MMTAWRVILMTRRRPSHLALERIITGNVVLEVSLSPISQRPLPYLEVFQPVINVERQR